MKRAAEEGPLTVGEGGINNVTEDRIGRMLQLIVSAPEYQFA